MRVGLVIYGSLDTISGGYLYDRRLVTALHAAGDSIDIVSLPWRVYPRHLTDNVSRPLIDRLATGCYDLILQDELNHPSLVWINRELRRRQRAPLVTIVHHLRSDECWPAWQRHIYRLVERAYLRTVDAFLYNSPTTRRRVERLVGSDRPSVVAVPAGDRFNAGLTPDEITSRALQPGPLHIVFVGNVIRRKGLHTLIDALTRRATDDWRLTVAGSLRIDHRYASEIGARIAAAGLAPRVRLLNSVSDVTLVEVLREGHVLVVPSSYEGFGIVYLEGMGFGLPAIATTAGGAIDIIEDGHTGFLTTPDDSVALAAHLDRLQRDRPRLAAMGLAAHTRFEQHPTWQATMRSAVTFLHGLAGATQVDSDGRDLAREPI